MKAPLNLILTFDVINVSVKNHLYYGISQLSHGLERLNETIDLQNNFGIFMSEYKLTRTSELRFMYILTSLKLVANFADRCTRLRKVLCVCKYMYVHSVSNCSKVIV